MAIAGDRAADGGGPASRRHSLRLSPHARLATLILIVAAGLAPWTIFLGLTLPPKYNAGHWNVLWTGFDVALVCVLGYAAWAAWFRRQILATTAIVAGTLLLCDAWFDIVTSIGHRDQWLTLLTGFGGELPLAVFFFWLYRRIVLSTLAASHQALGDGPPPRHLRDAHILLLSTRDQAQAEPAGEEDDSLGGRPEGEPRRATGSRPDASVVLPATAPGDAASGPIDRAD